MTSYFDAATHAVNVLAHYDPRMSDDAYVAAVQKIESPVIQIALANACDAEFPDDLRRKICRVIAKNDYYAAVVTQHDALRMLISTRHSDLIADLHSIFHDLARRRTKLRETTWSDSPTQNLTTIATHAAATDVERSRGDFITELSSRGPVDR